MFLAKRHVVQSKHTGKLNKHPFGTQATSVAEPNN